MLDLLACDPNVAFVNIFHLIDEAALEGWQSGLYYADQTAKRSAQTVQALAPQTGGACTGTVHPWTPPAAAHSRRRSGSSRSRRRRAAQAEAEARKATRRRTARRRGSRRSSLTTEQVFASLANTCS
jgi:hypothetical protein